MLSLLLSVAGGASWMGVDVLHSRAAGTTVTTAAATSSRTAPATPALDQLVPALAAVATPTSSSAARATAPAQVAGGPCSDAMLRLEVRAPISAAPASTPTFELVVTNVSAVPCVRAVDKGLQELVLLDPAGVRIWGSNDCSPQTSSDRRTLAPGEKLSFPVLWSGLTSEPTCTATRVTPAAGSYVLRGRLDTLTGPDTPITLT